MITPGITATKAGVEKQNAAIDEKTRQILDIFEQISAIPRCSKHERDVSTWLTKWAKDNGLKARSDQMGNVVINVPATTGYENASGIVLQGHLDMVCEKTPESNHNFSKDPIRLIYDGDWLSADKTTLGADNGIGIAIGLALAKERTIAHPPLELLFTVEEETGLTGAQSLKSQFIEGTVFINIDSEEEGTFTIGAAGGRVTLIELPISTERLPKDFTTSKLQVRGLRGGHSGVDIHKHRGNANTILARTLDVANRSSEIRLISMKGGTRTNAIPRDAETLIAYKSTQFPTLQKLISEFEQTVQQEYALSEHSLSITFSQPDTGGFFGPALTQNDTDNVIKLLHTLPDGVAEMSSDIEDLVETSNNIATVELNKRSLIVLSFQRSSVMPKLEEITAKIEDTAARSGAETRNVGEYPAWEPNMNSALLKRGKEVYKTIFEKEPVVSIVHAGLECNVIGSKYPGIDMLSIGPTIENPHSPDEKLYIPSISNVWKFLVALLKSYTRE